jgi:hypothetical protein
VAFFLGAVPDYVKHGAGGLFSKCLLRFLLVAEETLAALRNAALLLDSDEAG